MQGALLVDCDGNVINRMTGDGFGHRVGADLEIVRGRLCKILMVRTTDVEVIFGGRPGDRQRTQRLLLLKRLAPRV